MALRVFTVQRRWSDWALVETFLRNPLPPRSLSRSQRLTPTVPQKTFHQLWLSMSFSSSLSHVIGPQLSDHLWSDQSQVEPGDHFIDSPTMLCAAQPLWIRRPKAGHPHWSCRKSRRAKPMRSAGLRMAGKPRNGWTHRKRN